MSWPDGHLGDDAAQLALGLLDGADREEALGHLDGCAACRTEVAELSEAADALLAGSPLVEPPSGFEGQVLARIAALDAPRRSRWPVLAVAAAVLVVLGLGAVGVLLRQPDEAPVRTAALATPSRSPAGSVRLVGGERPLLAVSMAYDSTYRDSLVLTLEVVNRDGGVRQTHPVNVRDGRGDAVVRVKDADDIRGVRMVTEDGTVVCSANFD